MKTSGTWQSTSSGLLGQVEPPGAGGISFTADPSWPWWAIAAMACALVALTMWTYRGVPQAGTRRVSIILLLRLAALLVALLSLARPSVAFRDEQKQPSLLIIVLDQSASMTIQDTADNKSRWQTLQRLIEQAQTAMQELDKQHITVKLHAFDGVVRVYDPAGKADGARSDYGFMLQQLYELYGGERYLRGVLILGDGLDNGTRVVATSQAEKLRARACPVHTFLVGSPTTSSKQRDVVLTAIFTEPTPVPVKGKLNVRVPFDAPGFENQPVRFHLYVDDNPKDAIPVVETVVSKATGNEVRLTVDAPDKAGEIKVTVKAEPLPGEVTVANNEISTFVTVAKEGMSILYVGGLSQEQSLACRVLRSDPRIRLYEINRLTDVPPPLGALELYQFDKQHYDVIILGDVSAKRVSAGNPQVLQRIHDLVDQKGTGLLMMGGLNTFGQDWVGTPVANLLPVQLDVAGQLERSFQMVPTEAGLRHYLLRLAENPDDNRAIWERLPPLKDMNRFGKLKLGATVLAEDAGTKLPMLVSQQYGKGRVLALAADTWQWSNYEALGTLAGIRSVHPRFWKQVALWLAQQEESTGNIWVRPEARRLPTGSKQVFEVGARGKGGVDLDNGTFQVKVINPQGAEESVPVLKEGTSQRGTFWKTEQPGEYKIVVQGEALDADGKTKIEGTASVRFLAYQDTAELARQAADPDFMARLATAGGGKAQRIEEFPKFLQDIQNQPLPNERPRLQLFPDWRSSDLSPIQPLIIGLFVLLLSLEWYLRRKWGLV